MRNFGSGSPVERVIDSTWPASHLRIYKIPKVSLSQKTDDFLRKYGHAIQHEDRRGPKQKSGPLKLPTGPRSRSCLLGDWPGFLVRPRDLGMFSLKIEYLDATKEFHGYQLPKD